MYNHVHIWDHLLDGFDVFTASDGQNTPKTWIFTGRKTESLPRSWLWDEMKMLGVSENSVPLNPMVNDHYPY